MPPPKGMALLIGKSGNDSLVHGDGHAKGAVFALSIAGFRAANANDPALARKEAGDDVAVNLEPVGDLGDGQNRLQDEQGRRFLAGSLCSSRLHCEFEFAAHLRPTMSAPRPFDNYSFE